MRIIYVFRSPRSGGFSIENIFTEILRSVNDSGHEVVVYTTGTYSRLFIDVWLLRRLNGDVYHITGDINYIAMFLNPRKVVITVHDIGHYMFALRGLKRLIYGLFWFYFPLRWARSVTAVSDYTKSNLVKAFNINYSKIIVVPNCVSSLYHSVVATEFNTTYPRILQVGTKKYKNVPRLVRALNGIPCRLVLIGMLDDEIRQALKSADIDYENHVNLTSSDLLIQYTMADIVTFISVGEGFGMPIIEAQAAGRPVITSSVSPMPEVAGVGACLVNPLSIEDIRGVIFRVISCRNYRTNIVLKGLSNASLYSVSSISQRYLAIYNKIWSERAL